MERLLTEEEIGEAITQYRRSKFGVGITKEEEFRAKLEAQDQKTLQAIGWWLDNLQVAPHLCAVLKKNVEALKRGEWPDE